MDQNLTGSWRQKKYFKELRKLQNEQQAEKKYLDQKILLFNSKIDKLFETLENSQKEVLSCVSDGFINSMNKQADSNKEVVKKVEDVKELFEQLQELLLVVFEDHQKELLNYVSSGFINSMKTQSENNKSILENLSRQEEGFDQLQELMKIIIAKDLLEPIVSELA